MTVSTSGTTHAWSTTVPPFVSRTMAARAAAEQQLQQLQMQQLQQSAASQNSSKTSGKRFVRRAKRWAELQQRRAASVSDGSPDPQPTSMMMGDCSPPPPLTVDPTAYHHAATAAEYSSSTAGHLPLTASRSLPYSLASPSSCSGKTTTYDLGKTKQLRVTEGINEYGYRTLISVYRTPPQLTVYPRVIPQSLRRSEEEIEMIRRDLHGSSLGSTASSPVSSTTNSLNSSIDNDEYKEFFPRIRNRAPEPTPVFRAQGNHISLNTVPPPDRTWMMIRHADPERPIATFTVLCYNVLCDKYATQNLYSYCPSWALNWEYRKQSIIKEIRNYEADIITLQEVETEQYKMLFKPEMAALGYSSIFQAKSRAKTMNEEDRKYVDGCAIFWKNDKFELSKEQLIEFSRVVINKCNANENMLNRVMPRDNIGLCAVLKIKDAVYNNRTVMRTPMPPQDNVVGSPLIVCTAHIHWDPEFCDVKLVQSMMLAHELWRLVEEVSESHRIQPHQCPVLVCGDLNSLPDSGVFEFLSKSGISRSHPDLKGFKEDAVLERFSHTHDGSNYTHALRLDSAVEGSVVPFTNFTLDFKGMIDYIFSTPQSLARLGVLGPFDMEWVRNHKIIGFPHPHVPSDHIPIMAQYAMIPTNHQRQQPQIQHFGNQHSGSFGAVGR
ncbi:hypothetical protein PFISCL1PPCAC_16226 [Pristionchus fissidentatus]|uniref:poly(A)-specific ribonuclease n=1 Tax=Pristionchus fissidentatus TaxID=1538716 RepID=A0AAV5W2I0_9BILA|nr:hypothetical protein PFISCL1PPCAC_16226 [Pristionchus fissidentatus]